MIAAAISWLALIVAFDFGRRRVPNTLLLIGGVFALGALALDASPWGLEWKSALTGATLGFAGLLLCYALGVMGAGDVKFAAVLGLCVGAPALAPIFVGASVLAGLHAVIWLTVRVVATAWQPVPGNGGAALRRFCLHPDAARIPFAGYLALTASGWIALQALAR